MKYTKSELELIISAQLENLNAQKEHIELIKEQNELLLKQNHKLMEELAEKGKVLKPYPTGKKR